jgi:flagellar assembly protein FliH
MKSYSKVFKATHLSLIDEVKVVTQPRIPNNLKAEGINKADYQEADEGNRTHQIDQLIQAAEAQAQSILERAEQKAHSLEGAAKGKIDQWWEENQKKFKVLSLESKQLGFTEGLVEGKQEAKEQMEQEYQGKIEQLKQLLQLAFEQKEAIIGEAEPFLLELSTTIASQIVKQELESYPNKFVELIKQHIIRFKEKEYITICVHPDDFEFIQAQRAHLVGVVNGETEIKIIPDHSVSVKGCIIRTAYGSVDASIDTQIEEIKKVILDASRGLGSGIIS